MNFFYNYFEDNLNDIKKIWEGINNFLGCKCKVIKYIILFKCWGFD